MTKSLHKLTKEILVLRQCGILVEIEMIDQIANGRSKEVYAFAHKKGGWPLYTFTDYVGIKGDDLWPDESWNTIEDAMAHGIKRGKKLLKEQLKK